MKVSGVGSPGGALGMLTEERIELATGYIGLATDTRSILSLPLDSPCFSPSLLLLRPVLSFLFRLKLGLKRGVR